MKLSILASLVAAAVVSPSFAADVNVLGARQTPSMAGTDVRVATQDLLNRATGLLNKNTLAMDNNIFITRSNLVFTQNDRLALRDKVQEVMKRHHEQAMTTATLTKDVLRAVSASDKDSALMTKASAVVVAKDSDAGALAARIADFVDAAGQKEMETEQSIQSQTPRGVMVLIGTKDVLRQPTAAVNKNLAMTDNQIAVSRSALRPTQNDQVVLTGGAKVADVVAPAASISVGKSENEDSDGSDASTEAMNEPMYRTRFAYRTESGDHEQFLGGFGGLSWGLGWRYPLGYWNTCGAGLYGGSCGLGFPYGGFFYC